MDLAEYEPLGDAVPQSGLVRRAANSERPVVFSRPRLRPVRQQLLGVAVLPSHLVSQTQLNWPLQTDSHYQLTHIVEGNEIPRLPSPHLPTIRPFHSVCTANGLVAKQSD